jgi:hypothetical protein
MKEIPVAKFENVLDVRFEFRLKQNSESDK